MGFISTTSASSAIIVAIAVTQYMTTGSVPYNNTGQNMSLLIYLVSDRDRKEAGKHGRNKAFQIKGTKTCIYIYNSWQLIS